jgi:predicted TIM-barrel fold metal-dependent hydrolase
MGILDFHVHVGDFKRLREDIRGLVTRIALEPGAKVDELFSSPEPLEQYLRSHGAERAVLVAECGPGTNYSIDSELVARFAERRPFFIPFGSMNPNFHDVPKELEKSIRLGVRGFKLYAADHDFNPVREDMMLVYRECERLRLPITFHTGLTAQKDTKQRYIAPNEFRPIAEKHPDLVIILSHAGKPHWFEDAAEMVTRYPNVYIDTGLLDPALLAARPLGAESVRSKTLFGSDWPVCGGYSKICERYRASLAPEVLKAIFEENPRRVIEGIGS